MLSVYFCDLLRERSASEKLANYMKDKDAEHEKMLKKAYSSVDAIKAHLARHRFTSVVHLYFSD